MSLQQEFDFSVNTLQSLLWRNSAATRLTAILQAKAAWYDANQSEFWNQWITNVFDLRTANDFGCSVWAIILGIPLNQINAQPLTRKAWGFGQYHVNFTRGNFAPNAKNPAYLTTPEKQQLLRLRYFQITWSGFTVDANRALSIIFGPGSAYIVDNLNMTQTFVYDSAVISTRLLAMLTQLDIIPRPQTVGITYSPTAYTSNPLLTGIV